MREVKKLGLKNKIEDQETLSNLIDEVSSESLLLEGNADVELVVDEFYRILRKDYSDRTVYVHLTNKNSSFALSMNDILTWISSEEYISKIYIYEVGK